MKYDDDAYKRLCDGLRIDRDAIDEELIAQAQHFWHVAEGNEQAVSIMDRRKFELDSLEVKLDKDIREQMISDGEKVTEKLIEAAIRREQVYHRAMMAYLDAKRAAGLWAALRESYRKRHDILIELSRRSAQRRYDEFSGSGERREARERLEQRGRR